MKKGLISLLLALIFVALAFSGVLYLTYQSVDEGSVPFPVVRVQGRDLQPAAWQWQAPVMGGLLYKNLSGGSGEVVELGLFMPGAILSVEPPAGYVTAAVLSHGGAEVLRAELPNPTSIGVEATAQPGEYLLRLQCTSPTDNKLGLGSFSYDARFVVEEPTPEPPPEPEAPPRPTEPTLNAPKTDLQQGDVLSLQVLAAPGDAPAAQSDLGLAVFTPVNDMGDWYCAIPIGNRQAAGEYAVTVTAGNAEWQIDVNVAEFPFPTQDLTIDVTDPVIGEANSPAAYAQYREKIPPLFYTWDEERYWNGLFVQPAEGRISTEFGSIRITNGDTANPGIHWGVDIAAAEGTPIVAPNAGRVVLAEKLLNTGNTIVIEHGGGLKSYYFHMFELAVAEGDMVQTGQSLGAVGTTGYSTGPHLHFEMRIGDRAINPQMLYSADAGLYSAEETV